MKSELGKQIAGQAEEAPQPKKGELEKNEKGGMNSHVPMVAQFKQLNSRTW